MAAKSTASTKTRQKNKKTGTSKKRDKSSTPPKSRISAEPAKRAIAERVPVDDAGRVVVPARIRKALNIEGGQELSISLEGDVIKLQTLKSAIERAQAIARRKRTSSGSVVDEFIAERRAEAARE